MGEKQQACLVALGVPVDSLHRSMFMSGYSYDSRICQALLSYYNILYYTYAHEAGEQGILLLLLTMLLYIVAFYLSLALVCSLSRSLFFFFLGSFPQHSRCRATRQKRQGQGSFSLQPFAIPSRDQLLELGPNFRVVWPLPTAHALASHCWTLPSCSLLWRLHLRHSSHAPLRQTSCEGCSRVRSCRPCSSTFPYLHSVAAT